MNGAGQVFIFAATIIGQVTDDDYDDDNESITERKHIPVGKISPSAFMY